jgi:hypothetical protein
MPEEDDSLATTDEALQTRLRTRAEWVLAIALLLLVFVPAVLYFLGQLASVSVVLLPPLALGVLAVFVYRVWGRKLLRARRIAGIRDRRLLDAAARRDRR